MKGPTSPKRQVELATQAQAQVDALAASGRRAGVLALRPTLLKVKAAVRASRTPDELRARLVEVLLEGKATSRLGAVLSQARILGNLYGQAAAREDLDDESR